MSMLEAFLMISINCIGLDESEFGRFYGVQADVQVERGQKVTKINWKGDPANYASSDSIEGGNRIIKFGDFILEVQPFNGGQEEGRATLKKIEYGRVYDWPGRSRLIPRGTRILHREMRCWEVPRSMIRPSVCSDVVSP